MPFATRAEGRTSLARILLCVRRHPTLRGSKYAQGKTMLISIGAAIVSAGLARAVSQLEPNDLLRPLRLSRRSNRWGEKLAFLGAGAVVGGLGALLFAPNNGQETRSKLAQRLRGLSSSASNEVLETRENVPPSVRQNQAEFGNGPAAPRAHLSPESAAYGRWIRLRLGVRVHQAASCRWISSTLFVRSGRGAHACQDSSCGYATTGSLPGSLGGTSHEHG